jgi:hypothetical protein
MSINLNILAKGDNTLVFIAGDAMAVVCYLPIAINAIERFLYSYCTFIDFYRCHDLYLSAPTPSVGYRISVALTAAKSSTFR